MRIYISGISGTGMGPLALMAKDAGFDVCGSDLAKGAIYDELVKAGIDISVGKQDGEFLREKLKNNGIDWFVYTSALPEDHPELLVAREAGVKCTKRDDFTEFLIKELGLKMIAVAGTHGKTTTTAMTVWVALKMKLPVSYVVGTTLGFAPSGAYHKGDKYFIYEADEYDRNFLKFHPWLAIITCVSYDHPDIYKKPQDYREAFLQFKAQSKQVLEGNNYDKSQKFALAGQVRREDAQMAMNAISMVYRDLAVRDSNIVMPDSDEIVKVLNDFPGIGRRFERVSKGVYSDYAHHPEEIAATIDIANDEKRIRGFEGVVVVYQPHQNTRQHEVRKDYKNAFIGADKVYWLPTYLTREDMKLEIIEPEEFVQDLENSDVAEAVELDNELADKLREFLARNYMVVLMTAGPADEWLREKFVVDVDK